MNPKSIEEDNTNVEAMKSQWKILNTTIEYVLIYLIHFNNIWYIKVNNCKHM